MYVDLNSLCSEMRIMDVMGVVSIIREEIHAETQCNASVGVGRKLTFFEISTFAQYKFWIAVITVSNLICF